MRDRRLTEKEKVCVKESETVSERGKRERLSERVSEKGGCVFPVEHVLCGKIFLFATSGTNPWLAAPACTVLSSTAARLK